MNIKKLILTALATLAIVVSQSHGSALKTGLEAAKNSLSSLAQTNLGKAFLDHKGKVALAIAMCSVYEIYNELIKICPNKTLLVTSILRMTLTGESLMENVNAQSYIIAARLNEKLSTAILFNDQREIKKCLQGERSIKPDRICIHRALAKTHNPIIAQQLIDHGAIKTRDEQVALLQNRPELAQQAFAPRQNELTRALQQPITHNSGTIHRLPQDIADRIASFNTGITVKKPMPESAKRLAAETEPKIRLELQQIVEEVYAESNKYKERLL